MSQSDETLKPNVLEFKEVKSIDDLLANEQQDSRNQLPSFGMSLKLTESV